MDGEDRANAGELEFGRPINGDGKMNETGGLESKHLMLGGPSEKCHQTAVLPLSPNCYPFIGANRDCHIDRSCLPS